MVKDRNLNYSEVIGDNVPLTEDDKDMLRFIYRKKMKRIVVVFILMVACVLFNRLVNTNGGQGGYVFRDVNVYYLLLVMGLIIVIGAYFIYQHSTASYARDIKGGVKQTVYYKVVKKEYFPITNQYFIGLNNPKYLFHEVSKETYDQVSTGDDFPIFRAPNSGYIFNISGKYVDNGDY